MLVYTVCSVLPCLSNAYRGLKHGGVCHQKSVQISLLSAYKKGLKLVIVIWSTPGLLAFIKYLWGIETKIPRSSSVFPPSCLLSTYRGLKLAFANPNKIVKQSLLSAHRGLKHERIQIIGKGVKGLLSTYRGLKRHLSSACFKDVIVY